MYLSWSSSSATTRCNFFAFATKTLLVSSSTMTARTAPAMPWRSNEPSSSSLATCSPTFLFSMSRPFGPWSAKMGSMTRGCPYRSPSTSEFRPQCVRNPPTAPCASIANCGTHPVVTSPRRRVRSSKPGGRTPSSS
ncbi:hypothetical protein BS78_K287700 [Paspalum vaginatum]|uniref:Uncharacterized protein n=1 Tax=Paspalum vaginatum TaxID=158149 RepID=A0A9W8CEW3_9POAL|nr:hypothetical protein BS78_K287700 [Paspalum vaginatum]